MRVSEFSDVVRARVMARSGGFCEVRAAGCWDEGSQLRTIVRHKTRSDLLEYRRGQGALPTLTRPLTHTSSITANGGAMPQHTQKNPPLYKNKGVRDPEVRFRRATRAGSIPTHRPDLGPCLDFIGSDNGHGYGQFAYHGNRAGYAHRYAWERVHGPIEDGLTVDHLCRNRRCCNVEHLELVTRLENYIRGCETRTECPNGHPYPPEAKPGERNCPICKEAQTKRSWARRARLANGLPDRRRKYEPEVLNRFLGMAVRREMSVVDAAKAVGCSPKYMDKKVRERRRSA